jgi:hypothetical protein
MLKKINSMTDEELASLWQFGGITCEFCIRYKPENDYQDCSQSNCYEGTLRWITEDASKNIKPTVV